MIGREVKFVIYPSNYPKEGKQEYVGTVLDAYNSHSGTHSGRSESAFGFGEGISSGSSKSSRKYLVVYYESDWHKGHNLLSFAEIGIWQLKEVFLSTKIKEDATN